MLRALTLGFVAAASAGIAAAMLVSTACITAPPPQLPAEVEQRPTILHESVQPPTNGFLTELPVEFIVPVVLEDPNESFQWDVFVDYNGCVDPPTCKPTQPLGVVTTVNPTPGTLDGGVVLVYFPPPTGLDPSRCHSIDFVVAHEFETGLLHTPAPPGGDLVTWTYDPAGTVSCSQIVYDAGSAQDGAFPPADAGSDALPAVPESGTD
jgi:hypothetical protein